MKSTIIGLAPDAITVSPERQRRDFSPKALAELKDSIKRLGLLHAVGITEATDPQLVYGERRYRAITELLAEGHEIQYNKKSWTEIPCAQLGKDIDPLLIKEIELEENLIRQDLTWQEEAAALAELRNLRGEQTDDTPPTLESLAAETHKSTKTVSNALALAAHLDDPDVAAAKTAKDAKKIIERKAKESHAADRAADFDPSVSPHTLLEGDSRVVIGSLPDGVFNAVVTDPPYGIDMHKDQSWDGTWHEYDDTEAYTFNLISSLLPEWDRVTEDEAHLYIFCDFSKFQSIRDIVDSYVDVEGAPIFDAMYFPFIWDKGNIASYPRPDHWPRKSYECILYAIKGNKPQTKLDHAVISIPQIRDQDHPAGKPADLYAHLIARSCLPGDRVLDCFAGQGTIFRAAAATDTVATGIELSAKYATLAKNTLKDLEV